MIYTLVQCPFTNARECIFNNRSDQKHILAFRALPAKYSKQYIYIRDGGRARPPLCLFAIINAFPLYAVTHIWEYMPKRARAIWHT